MKKLTSILSLFLISTLLIAADPGKGAAEIYEMIESKCSSTFSMSVKQDFKDLFDMDLDMNGKEKMVKGDFKRGKFLVVDRSEFNYSDVLKEFRKRGYHEKEIEKDDQDKESSEVSMMVDQKGNDLKEVHFIVEGDENIILLSIYGDIHLEKK